MTAPILVAEDDPAHRLVICKMLGKLDREVTRAVDGTQAVDLAVSTRPPLVFMDFNMPRLDGIEAARHIKAAPEGASIPIVVVTADATQKTRDACLAAGCAEVVVKPVTMEKMRDLLARHAA